MTPPSESKTTSSNAAVGAAGTGYLATAIMLLFAAGLAARLGFVTASITVFVAGTVTLIILAASDRITVSRRRIERTGLLSWLNTVFTGSPNRLRLAHIEQIETTVFQRFRRGGHISYAYRTVIRGRNARFQMSSARRGYARLIRIVLSSVPEDVLDNRSIELRDYFAARDDVRARARQSEIPTGDVLEEALRKLRSERRPVSRSARTSVDPDKAERLRRLGNELRVAGFLLQSLEAFRRAVLLHPASGWLLFDYGRCILSCAVTEKDKKLERRAFAMMRLAEQRAGDDANLLAQLGESYFQAGNWNRAAVVFKKALAKVGTSFRSVRGLAEIALRDGKFAHVIHNFSLANSLTQTRALKRWTGAEIEYFTKLNEDEEYMELEISRLSLMDTLAKLRRSMLRLASAGIAVIVAGKLFSDSLVTDSGWAISSVAMIIWAGSSVFKKILSERIPINTFEEE